jgi:hypothetical protein
VTNKQVINDTWAKVNRDGLSLLKRTGLLKQLAPHDDAAFATPRVVEDPMQESTSFDVVRFELVGREVWGMYEDARVLVYRREGRT